MDDAEIPRIIMLRIIKRYPEGGTVISDGCQFVRLFELL